MLAVEGGGGSSGVIFNCPPDKAKALCHSVLHPLLRLIWWDYCFQEQTTTWFLSFCFQEQTNIVT